MRITSFCLLLIILSASVLHGQDPSGGAKSDMNMHGTSGMMQHKPAMESHSLNDAIMQHTTSGTDTAPNSTPTEMVMFKKHRWQLMFHGEAFLNEVQQTGPRGA